MAKTEAREWVSFEDPDEDRTWLFDATFLLSAWKCIYNDGCQGVLTGPAPELIQGCCSYGAHFSDNDDVKRVEKAAKQLSDTQWQFRSRGLRDGVVKDHKGTKTTRLIDGACIFLNRPGFAGGPGCALHKAALDQGREPLELKPEVCWQLPLHREDTTDENGHVTSTIGEWQRRHWGPGGQDFHWWCTEAPEAFRSAVPVYESMSAELKAMVGKRVFAMVDSYLSEHRSTQSDAWRPVAIRR